MTNTTVAPRPLTPWVARILAVNAVVLLLQQTLFTSKALADLLVFQPADALHRPWTFVTYMFLHQGILHLAANSFALFVFGPAVERRFGGTTFVVFYLYCGIAAAFFSMCMGQLHIGPPVLDADGQPYQILGASGAIMGVVYAFARFLPETPLMLLLVPVPIKARWMVPMLAAYDVVGMLVPFHDNIAHTTHVGGLLAGVFYFVLRGIAQPPATIPIQTVRPRVPVAARGGTSGGIARKPAPAARDALPRLPSHDDEAGSEISEVNRVLDKISATGIGSLTADERRFLDAVSRRRRDQLN